MKIISSVWGTVAIRISNDDVGPTRGILQRDLAKFVGGLYEFNVRPNIPQGMPVEATPILQFQSGEFAHEDGKIAITQLIIAADGDAIMAQDTNLADLVLTDYLAQMDKVLGFRYGEATFKRLYESYLVVEFDEAFVEKTSALYGIQNAINNAVSQDGELYKLSRLAFRTTPPPAPGAVTSVMNLIPPDFAIERRVNEPLESNRFFCSAPLTTSDHKRALELVEQAAVC